MVLKIKPARTEPELNKPLMSQGYTFRFRQHLNGNFHGLWELTMLGDNGEVIKEISDADALNFCVENLMGELEDAGH